jgi:hypothetical protein
MRKTRYTKSHFFKSDGQWHVVCRGDELEYGGSLRHFIELLTERGWFAHYASSARKHSED